MQQRCDKTSIHDSDTAQFLSELFQRGKEGMIIFGGCEVFRLFGRPSLIIKTSTRLWRGFNKTDDEGEDLVMHYF